MVFRDCQVDSSVYLGVTNIIVRRKPLQPMIPRMVDERRIWSIAHEPEMLLLPSGKGLIGIFVASQCSCVVASGRCSNPQPAALFQSSASQ